jgi:hypothetical protein
MSRGPKVVRDMKVQNIEFKNEAVEEEATNHKS